MIKASTRQTLLTKAIKASLFSVGVAGFFINSSAFAALTCDVGSSKFYSKSAIIKDITVKNTGNRKAKNVKIALTFNKSIGFTKAWGDVKSRPTGKGKTLVFKAKSGSLSAGDSIEFGLKGKNKHSTSSVSCIATQDNASSTSKTNKKPKKSKKAKNSNHSKKPTRTKKPNKNTSPVSSNTDKCPTSNNGALLVQNFDSFKLGRPSINDRKSFQKEFCTPLYTFAGFGAKNETKKSKVKEARDARGRAAAGQREQAQNFVRLEIVKGKHAFHGKSIKVMYPKGGNTSSHSGIQYPEHIPTTMQYDRDTKSFVGNNSFQEMYVSYWVKFEKDFTWQLGGKLPGMIAERGFRDTNRDERVNTRLMWRENGKLEFYIHSPYLKDKTAGKAYEDRIYWNNGSEVAGHAKLTKGKWHHIEFRMKLNDVVNGKVYANGELEGWLDGKQAAYYNDVTLRGDKDFNINTFFFSTFFGGSSGNGKQVWWPTKNVYAYFDQIEVSDQRIGCCTRKP